jgi:tetratricopeptide (TPR) repeat protein
MCRTLIADVVNPPRSNSRLIWRAKAQWILASFSFSLTLTTACSAQTSRSQISPSVCAEELQPGVVAETVLPDSEGERAGITPGDIILAWTRGNTKGRISSPFDVTTIETEAEPKGRITLYGVRRGSKHEWTVGPENWGIKVRPNLPPSEFSAYQSGRSEIIAGRLSNAGEKWRSAGMAAGRYRCSWLLSWFYYDVASVADETNQWQVADAFYQNALNSTSAPRSEIRAILLNQWASSFDRRGDRTNAEKYYKEELLEREETGKSIGMADALNSLGNLSIDRKELTGAESYFNKAEAIEQELAPKSLNMTTTLVGLGNASGNRGDLSSAEDFLSKALRIVEVLAPRGLSASVIWNNLGSMALSRGDLSKARAGLERALAIKLSLQPTSTNLLSLGPTLNNLGILATQRGELSNAEKYFLKSQAIYQSLATNSLDYAVSLDNLASIAQMHGKLDDAERYLRLSWGIRKTLDPKSLDAAKCLEGLGNLGRVIKLAKWL